MSTNTLSPGSISALLALSPCPRAKIVKKADGSLAAVGCHSSIHEQCEFCAAQKKKAQEERLRSQLEAVAPSQVAWCTLTFAARSTVEEEALQNSLFSVLFGEYTRRVRRAFEGETLEVARVVELKQGRVHAHLCWVRDGKWSASDLRRLRSIARRVSVASEAQGRGKRVRFGRVTSAATPESEEHAGNLPAYMVKEVSHSWKEGHLRSMSERLERFVYSLRARGEHRLAPVRRATRTGGFGFRGARLTFSKGWGSIGRVLRTPLQVPPVEPVESLELGLETAPTPSVSGVLTVSEFMAIVGGSPAPTPVPLL